MYKKIFLFLGVVAFLSLVVTSGLVLAAPSQTAQSIMVSVTPSDSAYEIEGTITWTFLRGTAAAPGCAMNTYTNTAISGPSFVSCTGGGMGGVNCATTNKPSDATIDAAQPAPDDLQRQQHAQDERCTFFFGGNLTILNYSQTATVNGANGSGNWKYSWNYAVAPVNTTVSYHQFWNSL